jgi:hypothetical protein
LTKTGWAAQVVDVDVSAGSLVMSSTHLLPGPRALAGSAAGTLVVRGTTDRKKLVLDGGPFAADPGAPLALPAGPHRITLKTAHGDTTFSFMVFPDTPTEVVLREPPQSGETRSAVIAPAADYLPIDAFTVQGTKVVVRYQGHVVVAHFGDVSVRYDGAPVTYDGAPVSIGGKLYLPLALLEKLTDDTSNGK